MPLTWQMMMLWSMMWSTHSSNTPYAFTMAADTNSYEDNPAELRPWYYTQGEPIASTFNIDRSCIFSAAGSSAASRLRVGLFCPITPLPAAINVECGSNEATTSQIRSRNDTPWVSIWSLYNIWLFFYFSCGCFSIGGPPKLRAVVSALYRNNQRHLWAE